MLGFDEIGYLQARVDARRECLALGPNVLAPPDDSHGCREDEVRLRVIDEVLGLLMRATTRDTVSVWLDAERAELGGRSALELCGGGLGGLRRVRNLLREIAEE